MVKRFYKEVTVTGGPEGPLIRLDERPLKTPAGRPLAPPTSALAEALADEWRAQGETIEPATMPLMRLVSTARDRVADQSSAIVAETVAYAGTDLLCYRATEPDGLVERQTLLWQPLIDWLARRHGAPLQPVAGVMPMSQPQASIEALARLLGTLDPLHLTAVADLTRSCGSLVLALAVLDRRIDGADAFRLSQLDEDWQIERWGLDGEAEDRRRRLAGEIAAATRFLELLEE